MKSIAAEMGLGLILGCILCLMNCGDFFSNMFGGYSDSGRLRYLALGDSYTIGESVSENERWPVQLVKVLKDRGFLFEQPEIIARTGWTTRDLLNGIERTDPKGPFRLVSLLIGVNNQYQGRSPGEYRREFNLLLQKAIGYAGGNPRQVFVLSIPDWGVTPFAKDRDRAQIAKEIDQFNQLNLAETLLAGAHYVDITPCSRKAQNDLSLVASDGLHPSGKMYARWVELALPRVLEALKEQGLD